MTKASFFLRKMLFTDERHWFMLIELRVCIFVETKLQLDTNIRNIAQAHPTDNSVLSEDCVFRYLTACASYID